LKKKDVDYISETKAMSFNMRRQWFYRFSISFLVCLCYDVI